MVRITAFLAMLLSVALKTWAGDYRYDSNKGVAYGWSTDDTPCAYTVSNTRVRLGVTSIDADTHKAMLNCMGWALTENTQYYAYSPYDSRYIVEGHPMTALPVAFTGQQQVMNGGVSHLTKYDYQTAQARSTADALHFAYNHLGSILRLQFDSIPVIQYDSIRIMTSRKVLTTEATMNLTNNALTPTKKDSTITLSLKDITLADNDSLVAYLMVAPADLSKDTLKVLLYAGSDTIKSLEIKGTIIKPGMTYNVIGEKEHYIEWQAKKATPSWQTLAATITNPTATVKDFPLDTENRFEPIKAAVKGDANDDGEVTMADAKLVVEYYLGTTAEGINTRNADVNRDGMITIDDANAIVNIITNK